MTGSDASPPIIRRTTYFTGRVQGVGFRYTAQSVAAGVDVTGFVRNLPDGRVELVAEGRADELDRLLSEIERAMRGKIRKVQTVESPAGGEFASFRIAY